MKLNTSHTNAPSVQTVAFPTPRGIVEAALAHYAVHVAQTAAEIAQSCEALRLLHERPEAATALFDPETTTAAPPATDKQRDLLAKLGYKGDLHNCGHASKVIADLLRNRQRPAKQRASKPSAGKRFAHEDTANRQHLRQIGHEGRK